MINWAALILLVVFDQVTKFTAARLIAPSECVELLPFLSLVNVANTGAAFGILKSLGNTFFIGLSAAAIVFLLVLILRGHKSMALILLLAGAAGNLLDRLICGYVRDFIDLHAGGFHWPAFNMADSYLTLGMAGLLWAIVAGGRR